MRSMFVTAVPPKFQGRLVGLVESPVAGVLETGLGRPEPRFPSSFLI